jgi:putative ABC transport system substrate-binding protein
MSVIGFLHSGAPGPNANRLTGFRKGLREGGFVEGQNVAIEFRWAEDRNDRLPELAADLVRRRVNVITALSATQAALAAKAVTQTIPIVFQGWHRSGRNRPGRQPEQAGWQRDWHQLAQR